jgi:hypothetical protein
MLIICVQTVNKLKCQKLTNQKRESEQKATVF